MRLERDLFDVEEDFLFGLGGCGGELDDGQGGFETDAGGGLGVGEELGDGLEGLVDQAYGLFAVIEGPVVLGVGEGALEGDFVATPVGYGVAVDAGFFGGLGSGGAAGQRVSLLRHGVQLKLKGLLQAPGPLIGSRERM